MTQVIIDLGYVSVSGQIGDFVCLDLPDEVREAAHNAPYTYVPKMLYWINSLSRQGLDFHGVDVLGKCFFKIVQVGKIAKG